MIKSLYLILNAFFFTVSNKIYHIDIAFLKSAIAVFVYRYEHTYTVFRKSQMDLLVRFLVAIISNSLTIFRSNASNVGTNI